MSQYTHGLAGRLVAILFVFCVTGLAQANGLPVLELQLKADSISGLSAGDAVSLWTDTSGYTGRDAAQTGTARPTYQPNELNGRSVVHFNGNGQYMAIADDPAWTFADFHMFAVLRINSTSSEWWRQAWLAQDTGGGGMEKWMWCHSGSSQIWHTNGSVYSFLTGGSWTPSPSEYYMLELSKQGTDYQFYKDGFADGTVLSGPLAVSDPAVALTIGFAEGGTFDGDIAEIRIYSHALTADQQNAIGYALARTYGLQTAYIPEPAAWTILSLLAIASGGCRRLAS